mmetsp:Transcript_21390/g.47394  ORF Transcript_21390/g.47394 Transcript_21390/m.47394 type:complete len:326 (-) Transcript_21390:483-1460(-)
MLHQRALHLEASPGAILMLEERRHGPVHLLDGSAESAQMPLHSLRAIVEEREELRLLLHREGAAGSRAGDIGLKQQYSRSLQEDVCILGTHLQDLNDAHHAPLLLQDLVVILLRGDLSEEVELMSILAAIAPHLPSILILLLNGPARLGSFVQHNGPLLAHLAELPAELQGLGESHLVALRRTASRARDPEAVLAVDSPELLVHHHGVGLLQLREARLVGHRRLAAELLGVHEERHLVIGLPHGLRVKTMHVNVEHLEEVGAILQTGHLLWHGPAVLLPCWNRDRHEHIQVILRGLTHLGQSCLLGFPRLEGRRRRAGAGQVRHV